MIKGILLDIEGTTTPISFVYDVLFPFARAHAVDHLAGTDLSQLKAEYEADLARGLKPPLWSSDPRGESGALHYIHWLMDQDRKSPALKALQGEIWKLGYETGELHGEVFPDVPPVLESWHSAGVDVRIYSSGSVLAQRLLFSTTGAGDLTRFLNGYFDTTTGAKTEAVSYTKIASAFALSPQHVLFLSDITRELDAAAKAGLQTVLCVRPGNPVQRENHYRPISTFHELST